MMYSKSADEMVRELNRLIVEAKETAADTRKYKGADGEAAAVYAQVWEFAARRAENTAGVGEGSEACCFRGTEP